MSRPGRVFYLIKVAKAILVRADDLLDGETEYLREELNELLVLIDELLAKIEHERELQEMRDVLHGPLPEKEATTGVRSRVQSSPEYGGPDPGGDSKDD
jgi:hypothetical protein